MRSGNLKKHHLRVVFFCYNERMHKTRLFPTLLGLLVFIAVVHLVATYLNWYWTIPWIDRIPHFSAGLLVALSTLWFFYLSGYVNLQKRDQTTLFLLAFGSALVVGLAWEFFEVTTNITNIASPGYFTNNGGDVLMDVAGGIIGYAYFSHKGYTKI
jgi:hypothetical protein